MKPRYALMINPFYPKDPRASFGKHVLTPTLALTSIAAATPLHWEVKYWDENLLQGPPPNDPVPEVVAITVHLTFARRAYELAAWFRAQGSIIVIRHRLTARVWRPLVEQARRRHLKYRRKLETLSQDDIATPRRATSVVSAGV